MEKNKAGKKCVYNLILLCMVEQQQQQMNKCLASAGTAEFLMAEPQNDAT